MCIRDRYTPRAFPRIIWTYTVPAKGDYLEPFPFVRKLYVQDSYGRPKIVHRVRIFFMHSGKVSSDRGSVGDDRQRILFDDQLTWLGLRVTVLLSSSE